VLQRIVRCVLYSTTSSSKDFESFKTISDRGDMKRSVIRDAWAGLSAVESGRSRCGQRLQGHGKRVGALASTVASRGPQASDADFIAVVCDNAFWPPPLAGRGAYGQMAFDASSMLILPMGSGTYH